MLPQLLLLLRRRAAPLCSLALSAALGLLWAQPAAATSFGDGWMAPPLPDWDWDDDRGEDCGCTPARGPGGGLPFDLGDLPFDISELLSGDFPLPPGLPLPGLSLGDLVEGDGFESRNGEVRFDDFSVVFGAGTIDNLALYRVLPTDLGFRLFSPIFALGGGDRSQVYLNYSVEAAEGLVLDTMKVSLGALAIGGGVAGVNLAVDDEANKLLDELRLRKRQPRIRPLPRGELDLAGEESVGVFESIFAAVLGRGDGGHEHLPFCEPPAGLRGAAALLTNHRFHTSAVPEPAAALLVALVLVGAASRRRRA